MKKEKMKQITLPGELVGKTITDIIETDDGEILLKFKGGSFVILEGAIDDYDSEFKFCRIYDFDIRDDFDYDDHDNKILVLLGVKTQAELDEFNDELKREKVETDKEWEEAIRLGREKLASES